MPNEPVRIGICGLGRGFMLSMAALERHPDMEIVAAADPNPQARERFAERFGRTACEDVDGLCGNPAVELIYIASPHEFHAEQAIAAARAGKHILVEKPMGLGVTECTQMVAEARAAGVVLMVGPSHGYDAPVALTRSLIDRGDRGQVRMITLLTYTDFVYRPRRPEELDPARGGGVVFAQATHQLDIVRRIAGSAIKTVSATIGDWDPDRPTEGAFGATIGFADGAYATLTYDGYGGFDSSALCDGITETGFPFAGVQEQSARDRLLSAGDETALKVARTLAGTTRDAGLPIAPYHEQFGQLIVSCEHADLRPTPKGVFEYAGDRVHFHALPPPDVPRRAVFDALANALRHNTPPLFDGRWGLATVAACEAMRRSSQEKRTIHLA